MGIFSNPHIGGVLLLQDEKGFTVVIYRKKVSDRLLYYIENKTNTCDRLGLPEYKFLDKNLKWPFPSIDQSKYCPQCLRAWPKEQYGDIKHPNEVIK